MAAGDQGVGIAYNKLIRQISARIAKLFYERYGGEIIDADDAVISFDVVFAVKTVEAIGKGAAILKNIGFVASAFQKGFFSGEVGERVGIVGI